MSDHDVLADTPSTPADHLQDTVPTGMVVEMVPVDDIEQDPRNARKGNVAAITESLREFGQHRPIVVQRSTNKIISGNHLHKAAKQLGWSEVAVVYVDDDDLTAQRRSLADNATGDKARWDELMLSELLQETGPVPGYSENDVSALLAKLAPKEEVEATYPIVARPNEKYDYVLVVATSEMDWAFLQTFFQLRKEKSYKSDKVALSHVVTVDRLQKILEDR